MNAVQLFGRLTKEPEVRVTQNQMSVVTFTLAVDRNLTKEKRERAAASGQPTADFIRCMAFGKTADTIGRHFHKGSKMLLTGRISTGKYQNRDGQTVFTTDVIVDRFYFVESAQQNNGYQSNQQSYQQPQQNYQQANYQQPEPSYQQTTMDDLPEGFTMIDEQDIPF